MPAAPEQPAAIDVALGFDYGTRRIGVAVGNGLSGRARALTSIAPGDWHAIGEMIEQWQPRALVVGLPLAADGGQQRITRRVRGFMHELGERFELPVAAVDERYSTIEADGQLRQARTSGQRKKRLRKGDTDAAAARVILESWLADC